MSGSIPAGSQASARGQGLCGVARRVPGRKGHTMLAFIFSFLADIPDISPRFDGPGIDAGKTVGAWLVGGGLVVSVIGAVVSIILIATGVLGERNKAKGWIALGVCILVAALLGSINSVMDFSSQLGF